MEYNSEWTMSPISDDEENVARDEDKEKTAFALAYAYTNLSAVINNGMVVYPVFND